MNECHACGRTPAAGHASVWTQKGGERWFCHGDDDESPTCYESADTVPLTEADEQALADEFVALMGWNKPLSNL